MSKKFAKFLFEKMPPKKEEHLKTIVVTAESSAEEIQFAKDWAKKTTWNCQATVLTCLESVSCYPLPGS